MEREAIQIVIEKDGRVHIEVRGVKGTTCLELTEELEQALGGQIEARQMTPEAHEGAGVQVQKRQTQHNK